MRTPEFRRLSAEELQSVVFCPLDAIVGTKQSLTLLKLYHRRRKPESGSASSFRSMQSTSTAQPRSGFGAKSGIVKSSPTVRVRPSAVMSRQNRLLPDLSKASKPVGRIIH